LQSRSIQYFARQFVDLSLFGGQAGELVSELETGVFVDVGGLKGGTGGLQGIAQNIAVLE